MLRAISTAAAFVTLLGAAASTATEFVDGDNEPVTVINGMHACPPGFLVTGVHVDSNLLLCTGYFGNFLDFPVRADFGISSTNQFPFDGTTMHFCESAGIVAGVHVAGNGFNCQTLDSVAVGLNGPLGAPTLDRGNSPTVRAGMHACPIGSVLVGAHFDTNTFLCARLPFCVDDSQCAPGTRCVPRFIGEEIQSIDGTCQ
jgi:hypothetical protein